MIPREEWQKGLDEWKNVRYHAEVSIALTDILIPAIEKKLEEIVEQEKQMEE